MAKIRFIERAVYQQIAGDVVHEVGDVIECRDDYASRWIRRGAAVLFDEALPTRSTAAPPPAAPESAAATAEALTPPAKGRK